MIIRGTNQASAELLVRLFGPLALHAGDGVVRISRDSDVLTIADVRQQLIALLPEHAAAIRSATMAADGVAVGDDVQLAGGEELAVIAMVSGG